LNISNEEHPGWIEISVLINPVAHEGLSAFLFDLGCQGIVSEDFGENILKAYLPFQKDIEDNRTRIELFLHELKNIFPEIATFEFNINRIENQDWNITWRKFFHSDQVTENLLIIPEWEPVPDNINSHVIRIDPGPAFGTGQHPTTRMCLKAMEQITLPNDWTLIDIGTGSGILAIYGIKLGANKATAIDIDTEAVRWAKRNIELNNISDEIYLSIEPLEQWEEKFPIITANLILNTILELSPHFTKVMTKDGYLILSGILIEQIKEVEEAIAEYGLYVEQSLFQEEWACLITKLK
jgi:ribosomal protein L11 methyltransferase